MGELSAQLIIEAKLIARRLKPSLRVRLECRILRVVTCAEKIEVARDYPPARASHSNEFMNCLFSLRNPLEQVFRPHDIEAVVGKLELCHIPNFKPDVRDAFGGRFAAREVDVLWLPVQTGRDAAS